MRLKFPEFLINTTLRISNTVHTESGIEEVVVVDTKCIYNEKIKQVLNAQRELITLSGICILKGDVTINPGDVATIGEQEKVVYSVTKPRNPDGSVFSTEVYFV